MSSAVATTSASSHEPLVLDLARIDPVIARALAAIGVDWTGAAPSVNVASARKPGEYALSGLRRAIAAFGLSPFDCDVVLLALAPEVDDRYAAAFAALHRNAGAARPSVGLVFRLLAESIGVTAVSAFAELAPTSRLVSRHLVRLLGDGPHATRSIALPQSVWLQLLDDRPPPSSAIAAPSVVLDDLVLAARSRLRAEHAIREARSRRAADVLVAVHGPYGRRAIAEAIAAALDHQVMTLPPVAPELARLGDLLRDARWWRAVLLAESGWAISDVVRLCEEASSPVIAIVESDQVRELISRSPRPVIEVALDELERAERRALWQRFGPELDSEETELLSARYRFGPGRIVATADLARGRAAARDERMSVADISEACRSSGLPAARGLVQRLDSRHDPSDLVVAGTTRRELELLESATRHGHRAFSPEGAGARLAGAGGIVALFAGPPGTGKTMSARIIADRLELDLLRIDLSQVVNKYIGETEKHLEQVFREGEATGAMLFFDEADALFGKRTDVRDAHDRYANLETAFLLQRLETHRGTAILATNIKENLDAAFVRRIQILVDFELPDAAMRRQIWDRHLVPAMLADDVDLEFLSQFAIAGGDIRNAVTSAVLFAAREGTPIAMLHLVLGVWRELYKAGRLVPAADFGPFRDAVIDYAQRV